jgi:flavodoxin
MKKLVVFYSRTGTTKKLAGELAKKIKADVDEVIDEKDRSGAIGWLASGRDAGRRAVTKIKYNKDPGKYELILIGTPIWSWNMAPAVRTYIGENKDKLKKKKVGFFCTMGGNNSKNTFKEMQEACGKKGCCLDVRAGEIGKGEHLGKLKSFVEDLK